MNKIKTTFFLIVFFSITSTAYSQLNIWRIGTARTLPKGIFRVGVFNPLSYGITDKLEVSTHPLLFFVFPNASVKKLWYVTERPWYLSTRHTLNYPSIALNIVSRKQFGGVLPENTKVPFILGLSNEFLASTWLIKKTSCTPPDLLLTLKLGLKVAAKIGDNTIPTIDYPLIYQRTAIYQKKTYLWYFGAGLDGYLPHTIFNFSVDFDLFSVKFFDDYAVEHKGLLVWSNKEERFTVAGGYLLSWGTYPFGTNLKVFPLIDCIWKFKRKRKVEKGLFKQGTL